MLLDDSPLINTTQDVIDVTSQILLPDCDETSLDHMKGRIDMVRMQVQRAGTAHVHWKYHFQMFATSLHEFLHRTSCDVRDKNRDLFGLDFCQLLVDKHKRYGAAPLIEWGCLGILIRISSKVARAKNLIKNPDLATGDETLTDTYADILGYCVLGIKLAEREESEREHRRCSK